MAPPPSDPGVRLAVIGADHPHVFTIVEPLLERGAVAVAHAPGTGMWPDAYRGWRTDADERTAEAILGDPTIDLVVTAAVPDRRAEIAVAALEQGKHVLADKPGVTSVVQLDAVVAAAAAHGKRWWVLFSERFEHPSVEEAVRMAASGEIGRIVHVSGAGPHSLGADLRPEWFWEPARTGGILADLAAHQADQFLAVTGATAGEVVVLMSATGNVANPDHPAFEDVGHVIWAARGVVGHHRVDYLEPAGLGAWGDPRLTIVGTEATVEVRPVIDVAGQAGGEHLIVIDGSGTRRPPVGGTPHWADRFLADLADDGERLMARHHSEAATRLALAAQEAAAPWPTALEPGGGS